MNKEKKKRTAAAAANAREKKCERAFDNSTGDIRWFNWLQKAIQLVARGYSTGCKRRFNWVQKAINWVQEAIQPVA